MIDTKLVDLDAGESLADELTGIDRVGLDTEFMREKTFYPQLCLVQVATEDVIYCVDPLGDDSADDSRFEPAWETLLSREWVLHSGRQDIEVIYQAAARMPARVFDTQIAASLVGLPPQIGYANLVSELFGVSLAKSHTRADWSRRPLPDAYVRYAAEDVAYLLPAFERLVRDLGGLGRLDWAIQDSLDLTDPALYANDPALAIRRLTGARNLGGPARAAAERLAAWREAQALQRDRPRQWIMKDTVLLDIASRLPESRTTLAATEGLSKRTLARAADKLLDIVAEARARGSAYEPPRQPDERQKAILREMQAAVLDRAKDLGIAAETIAPKKELSQALNGGRDSRVFRGWRRELVGKRLLDLLQGAS